MKKDNGGLLFVGVFAVLVLFGLTGQANAATAPNIGAASSFSVLGQTAITNVPTSAITGDVGMNASGASITGLTTGEVAGTIYATDVIAPSEGLLLPAVQSDASAAYSGAIPALPTEGTPIAGSELNGITRGPGVYDLVGAAVTLSGGVLTLDGPGVYIFRTPFALTSAGSISLINGARACDVFWNVGSLATINSGGAGTSFAGTILAGTGVHFGTGAILDGRALAVGGDVTMDNNTILGPTCVVPPPAATTTPTTTTTTSSSSGGSARPRIHVEKSATPDELFNGSGTVVYDYVITNAGSISINNVEVTDDKCSDVEFVEGDADDDNRLDANEEWSYQCSTTLNQTTTNTVTAKGVSSSGRSTQDTDEATVVVMNPIAELPLVQSAINIPRLPDTGVAPRADDSGMLMPLSISFLAILSLIRGRGRSSF